MNTLKTNFAYMAMSLIAVLAVAQACTESKSESSHIPKQAEPVPVRVMELKKTESNLVITASGELTTDDETVLGFKMGGVVNSVVVKEGDRIRKGQLLASLDLTEINAQVAQTRYAFEKAQRDFNRAKNLYRDSVATLEQMQNAQTALNLAREQLEAARFNKNYSEIHAPADGYVLRKYVNSGQVISSGNPILMTNGAIKGKWVLKVGVSDKQWAAIRNNDEASVAIDAFPNKVFDAFVVRKSGTSNPMTGAFTVEVQLKDADVKLASGMFGTAKIHSGQVQTSWAVPYESVLDANDEEGYVFVTDDNQTAHRQPVVLGSFDENEIRISEGLEQATSLIVSGSAYLTDNSPIRIVQ